MRCSCSLLSVVDLTYDIALINDCVLSLFSRHCELHFRSCCLMCSDSAVSTFIHVELSHFELVQYIHASNIKHCFCCICACDSVSDVLSKGSDWHLRSLFHVEGDRLSKKGGKILMVPLLIHFFVSL